MNKNVLAAGLTAVALVWSAVVALAQQFGTAPEARAVAVIEQKRNYTACLHGYGYCDPSSLTPSELETILTEHK